MKRTLYSVVIGTLVVALTAGAQQVTDRRPERARPQQRAAPVQAARPMNTNIGAHHFNSAAQYQPRSYTASRSNAAFNRAARPVSSMPATTRDRNFAANRTRNLELNRNRNSVALNRERNLAATRTRNVEVNRARNAGQFPARNGVAGNRQRNANQTGNFAYYRGANATINNNFDSAAFSGPRYSVFRNYHRQWHDRDWWRSHYNRIVFVDGGWYYWNAGYWFPAWGYDPYVSYAYDGPIYAVNGLPPDEVIADVQEQLASDGYYDGPVDGVLGPMTREAIAAFQADNGLVVTSVIDQPTLASLGIA